ncbi:MAG: T9SS type A sorting domain-containing protein [Paludibacteraceae bacterium]|nr:T9SS type A sorting domain-containing protein [Paludibacteraceae bacterium]MBN2787448.1 T9SS type A sorting domain-containing protein [Paludibacteraceae bacterium]
MKKVIVGCCAFFCCCTFSLAQTLDVNFTGNCYSYTGLTKTQTLAQSFTATLSGELTKVKVGVSVDSCAFTSAMTGVAKVYTESCLGTVLTTQPYSFATDSSLAMLEINFTTPPLVAAGNVYALELSVDSGQKCKMDMFMGLDTLEVFGRWHMENEYNCGGTYAGGTAYDPGCVAYPGDYYLQTYVNTSVKIAEVLTNTCVIYPNPATNQLFLKPDKALIGNDYYIFDIRGNRLLSGIITSAETCIELGNLPDGIYSIQVAQQFSQLFVVKK